MNENVINETDNNFCPLSCVYEEVFEGLDRCVKCGLGRSKTVSVNSEEQNYLDIENDEVAKRKKYFDYIYRTFVKSKSKGKKSLDVGCSLGSFVDVFSREMWEAHGIDSYDEFVGDGEKLFQSTLDEFDRDDEYDFISLIHSFEHMKDPLKALSHIRRLLKPTGECLIVVPNFNSNWSRIDGKDWCMLNLEHHYYHYTIDALKNILKTGGFEVKCIRTYSGYFTPSTLQIRLAKSRFFDEGWGSVQPMRSILFRLIHALRPVMNLCQDKLGYGSEIQLLIRPVSS